MTKKVSLKVRRKLFQAGLEELLEKHDLFMDIRMKITPKEIRPLFIVDGLEVLQKKQNLAQVNQVDVKKEEGNDGKSVGRPEKKSKKDKGKN